MFCREFLFFREFLFCLIRAEMCFFVLAKCLVNILILTVFGSEKVVIQ